MTMGLDELTVQCPYCLQIVAIDLEYDVQGTLIQDCEVCCRPWLVRVSRDANGEASISVERN